MKFLKMCKKSKAQANVFKKKNKTIKAMPYFLKKCLLVHRNLSFASFETGFKQSFFHSARAHKSVAGKRHHHQI